MYLRLQWVSRVLRGVVTRLEAGLAGVSLSVAGGLQDELLNLTARRLAVTNVMTNSEVKVLPLTAYAVCGVFAMKERPQVREPVRVQTD